MKSIIGFLKYIKYLLRPNKNSYPMKKQKKDIISFNKKGQKHGHWELYTTKSNIMYRGSYINGKRIGYWEYYGTNNKIYSKDYVII